ncbi:MAG: AI-2E family transporter [Kiloniellales bacterium]
MKETAERGDKPYPVVTIVLTLTGFGVGIALLYFGRQILIPLVLALFLTVLLTAVIEQVETLRPFGWTIPRWVVYLASLLVLLMVIGGSVMILADQAESVAAAAPRYAERLEALFASLTALAGEEIARRTQEALAQVDLGEGVSFAIGSASAFLNGLFLVLLFLTFLLLERRPFQKKLALLSTDPRERARLVDMARSISSSLQRYVGIKTLASLLTAGLSYAAMKPVGLDFAETWALLAFFLNFIPTVGSILGVFFPTLAAMVQFDTVTPILVVLLGCGAAQFLIGNIVEPSMTGKSLNLSTFVVILSLTFWGFLWGTAGALLSVPIAVVVMIVLAHIPSLRWIAVLMSSDGKLSVGADFVVKTGGELTSQAGDAENGQQRERRRE